MSSLDELLNRFEMHCLSSDESNNPCIPQIVLLGNIIYDRFQEDITDCSIGIQYGKRLIITKHNLDICHIDRTDILELVDVDPVKHQVLYMGPTQPPHVTPLLYMIPYAKKEVHYLIFFTLKEGKRKENVLASWEHIICETTFLEMLKEVLTALRTQTQIVINDDACICTAETFEHLQQQLLR